MLKRSIIAAKKYISLLIVISICIAITVSICSAAVTMQSSSDKYFVNKNTADIILNSDDGFTAHDLDLIEEQTSAHIVGVFYTDCRYSIGNINDSVRLFSVDGNITADDIIEGNFITSPDQCIAVRGRNGSDFSVGDCITVESDEINSRVLTVVGVAEIIDPDFDGSIFVDNSVFSLESYNRLLLTFDFLRKYNTYSDRYLRSVNDIISRLDNISTNRLNAIKSGAYDYRLLKLSRYDSELAGRIESLYAQKDELEKRNQELVSVKKYIDQTEQLIAEKSEQLYISSETIQQTIGAELKAHEEKLKEITALKLTLDDLKEEKISVESDYMNQLEAVDAAKQKLDSISDSDSEEYSAAQSEYEGAVKKRDELKVSLDAKSAELNIKQADYDTEYASYDAAYKASKDTYDKLMGSNDISSNEIFQLSLMNLTAKAEYYQKLEQYNNDYSKMQVSLTNIVQSVNNFYSSFAKLWYLSDRTVVNDYAQIATITEILYIIFLISLAASVLFVLYFSSNKISKPDSTYAANKIGFCKEVFKTNLLQFLPIAAIGSVFGVISGALVSFIIYTVISFFAKLNLCAPILGLTELAAALIISFAPMLVVMLKSFASKQKSAKN